MMGHAPATLYHWPWFLHVYFALWVWFDKERLKHIPEVFVKDRFLAILHLKFVSSFAFPFSPLEIKPTSCSNPPAYLPTLGETQSCEKRAPFREQPSCPHPFCRTKVGIAGILQDWVLDGQIGTLGQVRNGSLAGNSGNQEGMYL